RALRHPPSATLSLHDDLPIYVDEHDDVASMQRVAQMPGPALGRGLVAIRAVEQVFEVFAPDAPLDLGELALLGDGEGKHESCLLDRHECELLVVRRVVEDRDIAEDLV